MISAILSVIVSAGRLVIGKDSFGRPNGALGNAEIGGTWLISKGSISVVSLAAKGGTASVTNTATLLMPKLDYEVSAIFKWVTGDVVNVLARSDSSEVQNFMRLRCDGSKIEIIKTIAGTSTTLASFNYSWASGASHKLTLRCSGNTFAGFLDDVLVVSATDDNTTKINVRAGFGLYRAGGVPSSVVDRIDFFG